MMDLAAALSKIAPTDVPRKGPAGACDIYGPGSLDDFLAVTERQRLTSWAETQRAVDAAKSITTRPIKSNNFQYHWKGKCRHWDHIRDQIEAAR